MGKVLYNGIRFEIKMKLCLPYQYVYIPHLFNHVRQVFLLVFAITLC